MEEQTKTVKVPTPREIKEFFDTRVVGQEEAKKTLAVAIYNHYKRIITGKTNIKKSNILLVGPTGCGKTELARAAAEIIQVPFCICDATTVTQAGYVGDDVENMILRLVQTADMDISTAEIGIIFIDELDKISRKSENPSITRDVSGEGVQQALLKIVEGSEVDVQLSGGRKHPASIDRVRVDTSNILFIAGGSFEGIEHFKKDNHNPMGFGTVRKEKPEDEKSNVITTEDIIKNGIIPELAGRFPMVVNLKELNEDNLVDILTKVENSITQQYTELIGLDKIELTWSDEAIRFIAKEAINRKIGARGLKSIIEESMLDLMFEAPEMKVKNITVVVKDNKIAFNTPKTKKTTVKKTTSTKSDTKKSA